MRVKSCKFRLVDYKANGVAAYTLEIYKTHSHVDNYTLRDHKHTPAFLVIISFLFLLFKTEFLKASLLFTIIIKQRFKARLFSVLFSSARLQQGYCRYAGFRRPSLNSGFSETAVWIQVKLCG